jgi:hypothetical protein
MDTLRNIIYSGVGLKRSVFSPRWQIDPQFFSAESDFEAMRFALEAYRKVSVHLRPLGPLGSSSSQHRWTPEIVL